MQKEGGKKQLLIIDPKNEISFKGPYDRVVTEYFTLKNPTESIIAFKVKTTAPKKYCVRPNNGIITPNRAVQVSVMLQPGDLTQEKHKHKFMIQSVIVPNNNNNNVNQLQYNVDELFKASSPDEIMDSKFKCVFLDLTTPLTTTNPQMALQGGKNVAAQNFDHDHLSDGVGSIGDDLVNGGSSGINTMMIGQSEFSSSSLGSENIDNNNHNSNFDTNSSIGSSTNGHHFDDHISAIRNNNKKNETVTSSTTIGGSMGNKQHCNMNEYMTTSNLSPFDIQSIPSTTNSSQDVESKLKSAEEEIRLLKDKLQQVQQYASKFSSQSSSSTTTKNGDNSTSNKLSESLFDNNQLLIKISVIVVVVSFIVGTIFGKMF